MRSFLLALITALSLSATTSAQSFSAMLTHRLAVPVIAVATIDGHIAAVHSDGSFTMLGSSGGEMSLSIADTQITGGTLPVLSTSWVDTEDRTHKVTTPVHSTTKMGLKLALGTHKLLVRQMQKLYPPKKKV